MSKTKLELTWIGKDKRPKLEPRILLEDASLSYHAKFKRLPRPLGEGLGEREDQFDNKLIFGDNLLALKALEQAYAGKVKCVFIDPPYNTGSAFTHYDDGLEHSIWLSLIRDRLEIIRTLLSDDGSLWITIDDNEAHYLKVLCDEIFGRSCFIASIAWRSADSSNNDAKQFSLDHNHILVYSKTSGWRSIPLARTENSNAHYSNPDDDPRGPWFSGNLSSPNPRPNLRYTINSPAGIDIEPPRNGWRWSEVRVQEMIERRELIFSKDGARVIKKTYLADQGGLSPSTVWDDIDATGHNRQAKYELKKLFPTVATAELFATPKPEKLLKRIFEIATNPGDLVLDSFAGSGTTGAVAHKMGRRWIMIELGEHCHTHIIPRLKKVVDGEDQGGISKTVNWQGGGGFRYYSLAPSLLEQDRWGNWVVNKNYNPAMLAEALCKLEGFTSAPSDSQWWNHGYSSEQDFIYVTTQNLSHQQLEELSDEVGGDRSLLVCCTAFRGKSDQFQNLTLKKIPKMVLSRCEWAHDDYSLNVANLPMAQPEPEIIKPKKVSLKQTSTDQDDLFSDQ
ncbi:MAG: site-specific DNA-methyltransferase [Methylococcaceae bacterium]